ncbi:MAG: glycosyltransferase, partial [Deltaproteobacteria bacterium]
GRALVGLRAIERCADALPGYEVAVHSATPDVAIAAELTGKQAGIPVRIVPKETPHREILALHGRARISVGLSISDAISTSFLEAIVMGSFPVQSWTACADEWIDDGRTGLLVPPEDPEVVEKALRRALSDDALVDRAAEENARLAAERLDRAVLKPLAVSIYTTVAGERGIRDGA